MSAMTDTFTAIIAEADFPEGGAHVAIVSGWHVLVVKLDDGSYRAINDRCTHAASPLSTGRIRRGAVMCPLHGARFELASGACIGGAYPALRAFPLRVEQGMIEVAVPTTAPGMSDLPVKLA